MALKTKPFVSMLLLILAGILSACTLPGSTPEPPVGRLPIVETVMPTPLPNTQSDACLDGLWIMGTDTLDLLVDTMIPGAHSFLRVIDGELHFKFTGDTYTYSGEIQYWIDAGEGDYTIAISTFDASGTYNTLPESRIFLDTASSSAKMLSCTSVRDGITYEADCDSFVSIVILLPSEAPYRCFGDWIEIDIPSPTGSIVTMVFDR